MNVPKKNPKLLIFIVAYNASSTIKNVLSRIPKTLTQFHTEILIIDDSSHDDTFEEAHRSIRALNLPFKIEILLNPVNQGYGGNQKIGFHYAIENGFDFVALLHGDGQYAPEKLPELLKPLLDDEADAVFGSRMVEQGAALRGKMPLYKFVGNKILTQIQNTALGAKMTEFHSGYRIYSIETLCQIPFQLNTNDFHFDTEIIIQLMRADQRIVELPIPTYYGDEICHVNGFKYAFNVVYQTLLSRMQDLGLFYERKYDCAYPQGGTDLYQSKIAFESPHSLTVERIAKGSSVVDLGCGSGYMAEALVKKGCRVTGIDTYSIKSPDKYTKFIRHNLNDPDFPVQLADFDWVLLLDIIEHLHSPENFIWNLRRSLSLSDQTRIIVSTGNVAFCIIRLMLTFGQFNYGKRGILDLTHVRLFTFKSIRNILEQAGFRILETRGVPVPLPLVLGDGWISRILIRINQLCIRIWRAFFS